MKEKKYLAFFVMVVFTNLVSGQIIPPSAPLPPPPGLPANEALLFLAITGLLYGINKIRN